MKTVIEAGPIDEIIISTLPTTISRWLRQDLPHRVERKFALPVTVVTRDAPPTPDAARAHRSMIGERVFERATIADWAP